jgi:hypothetical protein
MTNLLFEENHLDLTRRLDFSQRVAAHHLIAFYDAESLMTRSVINLSINFETK